MLLFQWQKLVGWSLVRRPDRHAAVVGRSLWRNLLTTVNSISSRAKCSLYSLGVWVINESLESPTSTSNYKLINTHHKTGLSIYNSLSVSFAFWKPLLRVASTTISNGNTHLRPFTYLFEKQTLLFNVLLSSINLWFVRQARRYDVY